jgi:hypothetical protein
MALLISTRILFYLLFIFTITHTINSYRIHQYEDALYNINNEQFQNQNQEKHLQLRSVLWPKICFKMLNENHDRRYSPDVKTKQRPMRKCYP